VNYYIGYNILMATIIPKFFAWYFIDSGLYLLKVWKAFLLFNLNYFSIPILLKTLFSHWHRYYSPYTSVFDLWKNLESFVFNMMSRIIGAILRIVLIVIGVVLEIAIIIIGILVLACWLVLPAFLIAGFLIGFKLVLGI
jgi:hypothetical protein